MPYILLQPLEKCYNVFMAILFIILITIMVTALFSINFAPSLSDFEIKRLGKTNKRYQNVAQFIRVYPTFYLFCKFIRICLIIILTSLAARSYGLIIGAILAGVLITLADLLGTKLSPITTILLADQAKLINHYFAWTEFLRPLTIEPPKQRVASSDELHKIIEDSKLELTLKQNLLQTIDSTTKTAKDIMRPWDKVTKLKARDHLNPKTIDDLFKSNQQVFPVVNNNNVVGLIYLSDISIVAQSEKSLSDYLRNDVLEVAPTDHLDTISHKMAAMALTIAIVKGTDGPIGLVSLDQIVNPRCADLKCGKI